MTRDLWERSDATLIRQDVVEHEVKKPDDQVEDRPTVSVIAAVYNVAEHLPDFFDSLRAQTYRHQQIEVILVDDGSTDGSLELCHAFARIWDGPVRVLAKDNGGPASARNLGMDAASGVWLSFLDSDDMVDAKYFSTLLAFAVQGKNSTVVVHAAKIVHFGGAPDEPTPVHPLNFRFTDVNRVINLDRSPRSIHVSTAASLCRASAVHAAGVRFNERLRPTFEDTAFVAELLMAQRAPRVGIVPRAVYRHRERVLPATGLSDPRRYTDVLRYGHLPMLDRAESQLNFLPRWVQYVVLYDLLGVFHSSQSREMASMHFHVEVVDEFFALVDEVLSRLSNEAITAFDVKGGLWWYQTALLVRKRGMGAHTAPVLRPGDARRHLIARSYLYTGDEPPREHFTVDGVDVEPHFVSERQYSVLNRPFVSEREVWLSSQGEPRIWLNDVRQTTYRVFREVRVEFLWHYAATPEAARTGVEWAGPPELVLPGPVTSLGLAPVQKGFSKAAFREARFQRLLRRFAGSWVVMDREHAANDCGEIFFKWMRRHHPEIQSHFVIREGTSDWNRLRAEGYDLIAYGSQEWKALVLSARHMVSSQISDNVIKPLPPATYGERDWIFTFLQHGVTKDNIFTWLNHKKMTILVTSTQDEYDYCAGRGPSRFGNREVRLTGMPRFDDLLEKDSTLPSREQRYLLVAPTWRQYLAGALVRVGGQEREIRNDFMESDYARAWSDLLHSEELKAHADAADVDIVFLPHPNIQDYIDMFELPDYVRVLRHAEVDIRDVLARSRMMISDYSSIAFDMAYLYRHVVYYQFDHAEFFKGDHSYTPGYFDYVEDGFGPVAVDLGGVLKGVEAILTETVDAIYAERMRDTFPVRDGKNCERTFRALREAEKALTLTEASVAAPFDTWDSVTR